jgi:hypothetical protein
VAVDLDMLDLGHGVTLSRTYLHVMAHPVLAFSPAEPRKHHPGPWSPLLVPTSSRASADLHAVLTVPHDPESPKTHHNWASWITLLMRFATDTTITMTLVSEEPFDEVAAGNAYAKLIERVPEIREGATIGPEVAEWLTNNWYSSLSLNNDESFIFAVGAIYNSHLATEELGVVSVWGALERLFSTNAAELKYRVCSNIAAYLEPIGKERYLLFQHLKKLYDARSAAAHGSKMKISSPYMDSSHIASRAILRMVELGHVPTIEELERELFWPTLPEALIP